MSSLRSYLAQNPEDLPSWMENFTESSPFPLDIFFKSRVVLYPGSGTDGHVVELFAGTHNAHTFIYTDYFEKQENIEEAIDDDRRGFHGYTTVVRKQLTIKDLVPNGWTQHLPPVDYSKFVDKTARYGFLEILERNENKDDAHGAKRFAVLFLGADAVATFDALFCQVNKRIPHCVVAQDHGFGLLYTSFGREGNLHKLAVEFNIKPQYLLVGSNTTPWEGYKSIPKVDDSKNRSLYSQ